MADIVLIDDNSRDQRRSYGADYIDDGAYNDIIRPIERVNQSSDFTFLKTSKCVLIHDSLEDFIDGHFDEHSHVAKDLIIHILDACHIPYVCFSDGHNYTDCDADGNIVSLKKSEFYIRLKDFLDCYKNTGVLQFLILAYGKNYRKVLVTKYVKALFQKFDSKCPADILTIADIKPAKSGEIHYMEKIIELSQPALGISYEDLLDYIEDNEVSVREFQSNINNIINSISLNGKNTYTWK